MRRWLTPALVSTTVMALVAAYAGVWVHRTVFDTDAFMRTVRPALESPTLYATLADAAAVQVIDALDLEAVLSRGLGGVEGAVSRILGEGPDEQAARAAGATSRSLAALAPGIARALEGEIVEVTHSVIRSEEVTSRVPGVIRGAHTTTMALIRDDRSMPPRSGLAVVDGEVRLDLDVLAGRLRGRVADALTGALPELSAVLRARDGDEGAREPGLGHVTLLARPTFQVVRSVSVTADRLAWGLVALVCVLAGVTIAQASRRRATTRHLLISGAAALGTVALVAELTGSVLVGDPGTVEDLLVGPVLASFGRGALALGAVLAIVAALTYLPWSVMVPRRGPAR